MRLASVNSALAGETNRLLAGLAERAQARGLRVVGTVQTNTERPGARRCDMDVRVLPSGRVLRISQHLGDGARGCRLDPDALEAAVAEVAAAMVRGADLLIVNKFGKHEAEGRGFRDLVGEALAAGLAVIVGLNGLNAEAFARFCEGLAVPLAADPAALDAWLEASLGASLGASPDASLGASLGGGSYARP